MNFLNISKDKASNQRIGELFKVEEDVKVMKSGM